MTDTRTVTRSPLGLNLGCVMVGTVGGSLVTYLLWAFFDPRLLNFVIVAGAQILLFAVSAALITYPLATGGRTVNQRKHFAVMYGTALLAWSAFVFFLGWDWLAGSWTGLAIPGLLIGCATVAMVPRIR